MKRIVPGCETAPRFSRRLKRSSRVSRLPDEADLHKIEMHWCEPMRARIAETQCQIHWWAVFKKPHKGRGHQSKFERNLPALEVCRTCGGVRAFARLTTRTESVG